MKRRTFLKAAAAFVLAPTVIVRPTIDAEAILQAFTLPPGECSAYKIGTPFALGSLTYATDGNAAVRAELPDRLLSDDPAENRRRPPIDDSFASLWHPGRWRPFVLPDIHTGPDRASGFYGGPCTECGSRRVSLARYPRTQAENDSLEKYGFDVDDCTIGDRSCLTCKGEEYFGPAFVKIGDGWFPHWKLRRLLLIPECEFTIGTTIERVGRVNDYTGCGPTLLFRGSGFQGAMMATLDRFVVDE